MSLNHFTSNGRSTICGATATKTCVLSQVTCKRCLALIQPHLRTGRSMDGLAKSLTQLSLWELEISLLAESDRANVWHGDEGVGQLRAERLSLMQARKLRLEEEIKHQQGEIDKLVVEIVARSTNI